jgi:hypothetical protein
MTRLGSYKILICCVVLSAVFSASAAGNEKCKPQLLRPEVLSLVRPILENYITEYKLSYGEDSKGNFFDKNKEKIEIYQTKLDKSLDALISNESAEADEALAYLLNVYIGEGPDEMLVCEVINRGKRMLPLVLRYRDCTPLTGLEPLPDFLEGSHMLPKYAIEGINEGKKCEHVR